MLTVHAGRQASSFKYRVLIFLPFLGSGTIPVAMPEDWVTAENTVRLIMKEIVLSAAEFDSLPEYSCSIPTGTTIGKRWKAKGGRGQDSRWYMGVFSRELPVPTCCRYHRCIAGVVDDTPCQRVQDETGYVYDPQHPELWHERPTPQVEILWYLIVCHERYTVRSVKSHEKPERQELAVHLL